MGEPSLWQVVVYRCAACGYEPDDEPDDPLELLLDGCPDCGGEVDAVEIDRMEEFNEAVDEFAARCALVVERQPALRPVIERLLELTMGRAEEVLRIGG